MGVGEPHLLLTLCIVGGRSAFKVDGPVGHQRNPGRRGDGIELDLELVELELLLYRVDDLVTDVHRKTDRLLVIVEIGKRYRGVAMTEGDRAVFLDVLQRARELLGIRLPRTERGGKRQANHT